MKKIVDYILLHHKKVEFTHTNLYTDGVEYISQSTLDAQREDAIVEMAQQESGWTVDPADGSVYTFAQSDANAGYRLVVTDAAAGSRFYSLEKSTDATRGHMLYWMIDITIGNAGRTSLLFDFIELVCDNLRHSFLRLIRGTNI